MAKLQNVKAVAQMLAGEHKTQTRTAIGFSDAKSKGDKQKPRLDGEIWEELDSTGKPICWWELKDGIKVKYNVHPDIAKSMRKVREYLRSFPNCPKEICTCTNPKPIDQKFKKITGMCEDCTISHETALKMRGQFDQYAIERMRKNANSYLADAQVEVEKLKAYLSNTEFVSSENGDVENWAHDGLGEYLDAIDRYFDQYKRDVLDKFQGSEKNNTDLEQLEGTQSGATT